jgi:hypothetical protein
MTKLVTIIGLLAALVALALFWKPWHASLELKKELTLTRAELQIKDAKLQEQAAQGDRLREQQDALKRKLAELHEATQARRTISTSVRDNVNPQSISSAGKEEFIRRSLEDPRWKESWRKFKTAELRNLYADFSRERQLSPEKWAQFVDLLFDQGERDTQDSMRFLNGVDDAGKSSFTKEETDQEMKALLGNDAFEKFEAYDKTTTERMALSEVREQLSKTGAPLEDSQADTLLQIMMEERDRTPLNAFDPRVPGTSRDKLIDVAQGDNAEEFYRAESDLNRRILNRAASTLSSEQYEALGKRLSQYLEFQKISIEMARKVAAQKN